VGNIFIVGALDLARRGGRLAPDVDTARGLPVLALEGKAMRSVGSAADADAAVDVMTDYVKERIGYGNVRVGVGDAKIPELAELLAARLGSLSGVIEVVRYTVGPSVGCHTGPGTVGAVFYER
jgi:fatty acid-binding protein DegV